MRSGEGDGEERKGCANDFEVCIWRRSATMCAGYCGPSIPGETTGVAAASTLVCCSSTGSVDKFVAEMLMHLLRAVAAPARCATLLQGEAAGRSMAVPVNWRMGSGAGRSEHPWTSSELVCDRRAEEVHHRIKRCKHAGARRRGTQSTQPTGVLHHHCAPSRGHWSFPGLSFLYLKAHNPNM